MTVGVVSMEDQADFHHLEIIFTDRGDQYLLQEAVTYLHRDREGIHLYTMMEESEEGSPLEIFHRDFCEGQDLDHLQ